MDDTNKKTAPVQGSSSLATKTNQSATKLNDNLQILLNLLKNVKQNGNKYAARCPSHDDKVNSLSITQSDDGKILIYCHAGCETEDILRCIGLTMQDLFPSSSKNNTLGKIIKTYDYVDETGELLYQVVRYKPKDFRQRRPNGKDDWIWKLGGIKKVPYRLPELLKAPKDKLIFIVEGEKDVDQLIDLGLTATTNAGGAGIWPQILNKYFEGQHVIILPDNDDPGRKHAKRVSKELQKVAKSVRVVELSDLPEKGDVSDWLASGGTKEKLLKLVEKTRKETPEDNIEEKQKSSDQTLSNKQTDTAILIDFTNKADFFHTHHHELCVYIQTNNCWETIFLNSKDIKIWFAHKFYNQYKRSPGREAISEALRILEAKARFDGPEKNLSIRIAEHNNAIYIDLGNKERHVIKVTADNWEIIKGKSPVYFYRPHGYGKLPEPKENGSLDLLRQFVNIREEAHWRLLVSWMLNSLYPTGPYPLLALYGEHGSAKSTLAKIIQLLIDPNSAPLRAFPRDTRDLMIAATNSWIIAFDNLSYLKLDQSDALCRLATGGGYATRTLYENNQETIFEATRPLIINGIPEVTTKPDLADRSLALRLDRIAPENNKQEKELMLAFEKVRPLIFGALLDALVASLKNLPHTHLNESPRMADFATRVTAAEKYLGWSKGIFLSDYKTNQTEMNETIVESSPLAQKIIDLLTSPSQWHGTASKLLDELNTQTDDSTKRLNLWPKSANRLGAELRRLTTVLKRQGINIEFERKSGGSRTRTIKIEKELTADEL